MRGLGQSHCGRVEMPQRGTSDRVLPPGKFPGLVLRCLGPLSQGVQRALLEKHLEFEAVLRRGSVRLDLAFSFEANCGRSSSRGPGARGRRLKPRAERTQSPHPLGAQAPVSGQQSSTRAQHVPEPARAAAGSYPPPPRHPARDTSRDSAQPEGAEQFSSARAFATRRDSRAAAGSRGGLDSALGLAASALGKTKHRWDPGFQEGLPLGLPTLLWPGG